MSHVRFLCAHMTTAEIYCCLHTQCRPTCTVSQTRLHSVRYERSNLLPQQLQTNWQLYSTPPPLERCCTAQHRCSTGMPPHRPACCSVLLRHCNLRTTVFYAYSASSILTFDTACSPWLGAKEGEGPLSKLGRVMIDSYSAPVGELMFVTKINALKNAPHRHIAY